MKGISAVIATILMLMITIALAGMAYMYISGIFTSRTGKVIDLIDSYCSGTTIYLVIKNSGTMNISPTGDLTFTVNGAADTDPGCDKTSVGIGNSTVCSGFTGNKGANMIRVVGPSNSVGGNVYCA